jgi:hypothetical protein
MKLSRAAAATGWLARAAAACCCLSAICRAKVQAVTVAANWGDLEYWHKITATNSFELLCTDRGSYRDSGRLLFFGGEVMLMRITLLLVLLENVKYDSTVLRKTRCNPL